MHFTRISPQIDSMKGSENMARNRRDTCKAILQALTARGIDTICTRRELMTAIVDVAGSTRETRETYMAELKRGRFVKQIDGGNYQLNFAAVDDEPDLTLLGELTKRVDLIERKIADIRAKIGDDSDA